MANESRREEYLRLAQEAEIHQRLAKDKVTKEAWERVIVGYLELAEAIELREFRAGLT